MNNELEWKCELQEKEGEGGTESDFDTQPKMIWTTEKSLSLFSVYK